MPCAGGRGMGVRWHCHHVLRSTVPVQLFVTSPIGNSLNNPLGQLLWCSF